MICREKFSVPEKAREGWKNYRFTEGMVFLIDPFSLPTIKRECEEGIKASSMGICQTDMGKMVESLIDTLQNEKVKKVRNKFSIPVALTINKVDSPLLRKLCGPEAVVYSAGFKGACPASKCSSRDAVDDAAC